MTFTGTVDLTIWVNIWLAVGTAIGGAIAAVFCVQMMFVLVALFDPDVRK